MPATVESRGATAPPVPTVCSFRKILSLLVFGGICTAAGIVAGTSAGKDEDTLKVAAASVPAGPSAPSDSIPTATVSAAGRPFQTMSNPDEGPPEDESNRPFAFPGKKNGYRVVLDDFDKGKDRLTFPMSNGKKVGFNKIQTDNGNLWKGVAPNGKSTATFIEKAVGDETFQVGSLVILDNKEWTICQLRPGDETGKTEMDCIPGADFPEEQESVEIDLAESEAFSLSFTDDDDDDRRSLQSLATIDMMVPWTPEAECAASGLAYPCTFSARTEATVRGIIELAIEETNTMYQNSGVNAQLRLVYSYRVSSYTEETTDPFRAALYQLKNTDDGFMDEVHDLRARYGADMVALIVGSSDYCGMAFVGPSPSWMFSVTSYRCATGYYTFAHEVNHNMGCYHDRGTQNECDSSGKIQYGWRDPGGNFRDVMGYRCKTGQCDNNRGGTCPRVQMISNDYGFLYDGEPIGDARNTCARHLNGVVGGVSQYFPYGGSPVPSPTNPPKPKLTSAPTKNPTPRPTSSPSSRPTEAPTPRPTPGQTSTNPPKPMPPTARPTLPPASRPTPEPTLPPTPRPTPRPTANPTPRPTPAPTRTPTPGPTRWPTRAPTPGPTRWPTPAPTPGPTRWPTPAPTPGPTRWPTPAPTPAPTPLPTAQPTPAPTPGPTLQPTPGPTPRPTLPSTKPCFQSNFELKNTVDDWFQSFELKASVEAQYGQIGDWCFSSGVTSMRELFRARNTFNEDIGNWDVSFVKDMQWMFFAALSFNQDLSVWDVSSVTTMHRMFANAVSFNQDLSSWDVSSVTDMSMMFTGASSFNNNLSTWDVSSVTKMWEMFYTATSFNQDLSSWDVSSVTYMSSMFRRASSFNGNISSWNVSSVISMRDMFLEAVSFNGDLQLWDVSSVQNMGQMFTDALAFNGDLSLWDVSSVTNMGSMFNAALAFNGDISLWDVSSVTNMGSMFRRAKSFNGDISLWDVSSVWNMGSMFSVASAFNGDISLWDVSSATQMGSMFSGASAFNGNIPSWDVSSVTRMYAMFRDASAFNGDISSWDVSSVTRTGYMFQRARSFNGDISLWDVSSVTNMQDMFQSASTFNGDISAWNVSSATQMGTMFERASAFNQDLSAWDVSSAKSISGMFHRAFSFNQNLCAWGPRLSSDVLLSPYDHNSEFSQTSCPLRSGPNLYSNPPGPFCHVCT
ncbi:unnamed protein product [Cylindrotheca closterium]|uniref:Uncharacterized protein n=1 Tax=Cylindrotheca closterium TaxID=2856 RepID=A0AAD2FHU0_9STRA|nr:unnamed protein product [Cylindrotheca closterium]